METIEIIRKRHSVRQFKKKPIEEEKRTELTQLANELSEKSGLNITIVYDDPEGFNSALARYGKFTHVNNYIAVMGKEGMDETAGYYGEALVLRAQELGLNTCWVGLTFNKKVVKRLCHTGEKVFGVIALGYGESQGIARKSKQFEDVTSISGNTPELFTKGVEAALLAPTAMNQQNFVVKCNDGLCRIDTRHWSPYAKLDLGIVKYHFEIVSGIKVFD